MEDHEATQWLARCRASDPAAAKQLFTLLYSELRQLAESQLRRHGGPLTLGASTLVHELYLRIGQLEAASFPDRARFFAYASRAMRGLMVDYVRKRRALKRGSGFEVTLTRVEENTPELLGAEETLPLLNDALSVLEKADPRLAELVDMHSFGGLSLVEIAGLRGVSEHTVQRDWKKARLVLRQALQEDDS